MEQFREMTDEIVVFEYFNIILKTTGLNIYFRDNLIILTSAFIKVKYSIIFVHNLLKKN